MSQLSHPVLTCSWAHCEHAEGRRLTKKWFLCDEEGYLVKGLPTRVYHIKRDLWWKSWLELIP